MSMDMCDGATNYQAQCDAATLKAAAQIEQDQGRMDNAKQALQKDMSAAEAVLGGAGVPNANAKGNVTFVDGIPQFG